MIVMRKSARSARRPARRSLGTPQDRFVRRFGSMVLSAVLVQLYPGQLIKVRAQGRSSVQTASDGLTLPGALEIALRSTPMIRATSAGREMADAQVGEARASRSP